MRPIRIYVGGRIGKPGQTERIEFVLKGLQNAGFDVTSSLDRSPYIDKDWRDDFEGAKKELENLGDYFSRNKFDLMIADLSAASDGRTNEQVIAQQYNIPIYGFAPVPVTTPMRMIRVEKFFSTLPQVIVALHDLEIKVEQDEIAEANRQKEREQIENRRLRNPFYRLWGRDWVNAFIVMSLGSVMIFLGVTIPNPVIIIGGICVVTLSLSLGFWGRKTRRKINSNY